MKEYIATFHTHLAAMRSQRALTSSGISARLAPVPRYLSASCGTCVIYSADEPRLALLDSDVERVVERLPQRSAYIELMKNE